MKFKDTNLKRSDGTLEYFNLIWNMLRNGSIENVYLLQKNDWSKISSERKLEIDPRGILIDVYSDPRFNIDFGHKYKEINNKKTGKAYKSIDSSNYWSLYENVKNEGIDFILAFFSYGLTRVNIPHMIYNAKKDSIYKCLEATILYSGDQVWLLNELKVPWFAIATDPRYIQTNMVIRDLKPPLDIISQYNQTKNYHYIDEYPNHGKDWTITVKDVNLFYSGIEKLNLTNEELINTGNRPNLFSIASMQSSTWGSKNDYRFNELEKWILKSGKDNISIFGKWDEYYSDRYPTYFKGLLPYQELDEFFKNTKYTLIIPIGKNWVTSKWCEMLRVGVLPFFHPDYDTQFNTFPENSFLRVKNSEEMWDRIEKIESVPGEREKIVEQLQNKYLGNVKDGSFIFKMLNDNFSKRGVDIKIDETLTDYKIKRNELF